MRHRPTRLGGLGLATVALAGALASSCGTRSSDVASPTPAWASHLPESLPLEGALTVRPDERAGPALEMRFPWENRQATLGWGGAHLWARPGVDHVSVSAIVDAPARRPRWARCDETTLQLDRREVPVATRYVGRPMGGPGRATVAAAGSRTAGAGAGSGASSVAGSESGGRATRSYAGHYDAVQLELNVLLLRKLVRARRVGGRVCGDPFTLTDAQRATLQRFVEWFDRIATPVQHGDAPFYREVGPRPHALPHEGEDDAELIAG